MAENDPCPGWAAMQGRCGASVLPRRGGLCQDCACLRSGRGCAFDGCDKGGSSKGKFDDWRCQQHHTRRARGIADDQHIRPRVADRASPTGDIYCPSCQDWKAPDQFGASAASKYGKACYCRTCWTWRRWATKFGVSPERFQAMSDAQEGRCLCGTLIDDLLARPRGINIDHDHACCPGQATCGRCVRGLLCTNCNHMVGHYERMPAEVRAWPLIDDYLTRAPSVSTCVKPAARSWTGT